MEYGMLGFSLVGLVFTWFWLRKPEDKKDLFYAIFSLIGCIAMLCVSLAGIFL